jgi:predicted metal-binding membrane protein
LGGLRGHAIVDRRVEAVLREDRWIVAVSLGLIVALAWLYLWRDAAGMSMDMADLAMPPRGWDTATIGLTFAMWAIMMVGMMLPSAAPVLLLYAGIVRRSGEQGAVLPAVWVFAGGYLAAWTGFSLVATLLQLVLENAGLLSPMMEPTSRPLSAALLIVAGAYQWLPVKTACLRKCRSPLAFITIHWRAGRIGAVRMGAEHGLYCIGCCWALMLLLFAGGVMNLLWVALIAGFVLAEKLLPGRWASHVAGAALVAFGIGLLAAT